MEEFVTKSLHRSVILVCFKIFTDTGVSKTETTMPTSDSTSSKCEESLIRFSVVCGSWCFGTGSYNPALYLRHVTTRDRGVYVGYERVY